MTGIGIIVLAVVGVWAFKKVWYELGFNEIARKNIQKRFDPDK